MFAEGGSLSLLRWSRWIQRSGIPEKVGKPESETWVDKVATDEKGEEKQKKSKSRKRPNEMTFPVSSHSGIPRPFPLGRAFACMHQSTQATYSNILGYIIRQAHPPQ